MVRWLVWARDLTLGLERFQGLRKVVGRILEVEFGDEGFGVEWKIQIQDQVRVWVSC
jgi:hypothetical protein